jgi:tRNA dimethylallyltransferase
VGGDRKKVPETVSPVQPERFLILVGPTGVGKTGLSLELARQASGEIVSADSRLVYRLMDIGTAKPDSRMRRDIPHHMIDIVDPGEEYTCKRFEQEARQAIRDILKRGRLPIVVGGSGLYVRALTSGIFDGPARDGRLRRRLLAEAETRGRMYLWERLRTVDPAKAERIDPANVTRVIRALEVYEITGKPMSMLEGEATPFEIPTATFGLSRRRAELYSMIDRRVDEMMASGFVDEVKNLLAGGCAEALAVRQSLGYSELMLHLEGSLTLEEAGDLIKQHTRNFAKRQMTWFRKERDITWIDITGRFDYTDIATEILTLLVR